MNALHVLLQRLTSDQRGSIVVSFALVFVFMVGSTFFVIDMARYNIVQSRLQSALDLTLISVGRNLPQYRINMEGEEGAALKQDVYDYFYANIPESFLSSTISQNDIKIEVGQGVADTEYADAQYMKLEVSGKLPMLSAGFFDFFDMDIQASNMAVRRVRTNMEMVLALDNSSTVYPDQTVAVESDDDKRMALLRKEATALSEAVLGAAAASSGGTDADSPAHIGLVPFTDFVNMGGVGVDYVEKWMNTRPDQRILLEGYKQKNGVWASPAWKGCLVEPRPESGSSLAASALKPDADFQPFFTVFGYDYLAGQLETPPDHNKEAYLVNTTPITHVPHDGSGRIDRVIDIWPYQKNWTPRWGKRDHLGPTGGWQEPHTFWMTFAVDSNYRLGGGDVIRSCPTSEVRFLTSDLDLLSRAIARMQEKDVDIEFGDEKLIGLGYGGGSTIPVGLLWSWRMLNKDWRGDPGWGHPVLPRDGGEGVRKIIVLFSKGGNEPITEHASSGSIEQPMELRFAYQGKNSKGEPDKDNVNINIELSHGGKGHSCDDGKGGKKNCAFLQCPLNGLYTLDRDLVTPDNYDDSCKAGENYIGHDGATFKDSVNNYMEDVCQNIKNDPANIEIYTVTLGDDPGGLIAACASSPDKHFHAGNVNELSQAFKAITGNVTDFRMIQ